MIDLTSQLALLSARVYFRADNNRIPVSTGWKELSWMSDGALSGFSAGVYQSTSDPRQIVIAFTGTNDKMVADSVGASMPAAIGAPSPQVFAAIDLVRQTMKDHPAADITFTGHSLGGGLASLMAVYFNRPATVFAPAPFERSATTAATVLTYYSTYLAGVAVGGGIASPDFGAYALAPSALFPGRERAVSEVLVRGEAISAWPGTSELPKISGSLRLMDPGVGGASALDLHSISLHAAMLLSQDFTQAVSSTPALLTALFDDRLYYRDPQFDSRRNLLDHLLRHELGVPGSFGPSALLTQFGRDVLKLGEPQGDGAAKIEGLLAVLLQHYYAMTDGFTGELFATIPGGVKFGRPAGDDIGLARFADAMQVAAAAGDGISVAGLAQTSHRFFVQWGAGALAAEGGADSDAMIGGDGGDDLDGAGQTDLLLGGAGADRLRGGAGSDYLLGGSGNDTYRFETGSGDDVIVDVDGLGRLMVGDNAAVQLEGGKRAGENYWLSDPIDGIRYGLTKVEIGNDSNFSIRTDLIITNGSSLDRITVRNWQPGQLGITLSDAPAPQTAPEAQLIAPAGTTPYELIGDANGVASRDELVGSGGVDLLHGLLGDDRLDGGDNGDILVGGLGADRLAGGEGNDALRGGGHMPGVMRGNAEPPASETFVWLNDGPGWYAGLTKEGTLSIGGALWGYTSGTGGSNDADAGDLIDAGGGHDWVYGDAGADVIDLGAGDDIANGGQGADIVIGGDGVDLIMGDYIESGGYLYLVGEHGVDVLVGDAGDDVIEGDGGDDQIYGGADDDVLWGDDTHGLPASYHGDDVLDGGGGNDRLTGQGGDDELYAGAGDDLLVGDDTASRLAGGFHGADYLDGEAGADELQGQGGADVLLGGSEADALFGDDLTSRLAGEFHGADHLDGEDGDDYLEGQGGADELFGGEGADTLYGDAVAGNVDPAFHGDDYLDGEAGADRLFGGGGRDVLFGGAGNDQLQGDDLQANLPITAHGGDTLDGEGGDDLLAGQGGGDVVYGGEGNDTLMGDALESQIAAVAHGDDHLDGGTGNDSLVGGGADDVLVGGDGDDSLNGDDAADSLPIAAHGDDTLHGSGGSDLLVGAAGDDVLDGGSEDDVLRGDGAGVAELSHGDDVLVGGAGNDLLLGEGGADTLHGGAGDDGLWGDGSIAVAVGDAAGDDDLLDGGEGNDGLVGGAGDDRLIGGTGNDGLYGDGYAGANGTLAVESPFAGADMLDAGEGDDYLDAGAGDDLLIGGPGADVLMGGAGADRYLFAIGDSGRGASADVVSDSGGPGVIAFAADVTEESLDFASTGVGPGQLHTDRFTFGPNREEIVVGDLFAGAPFEIELGGGLRLPLQRLVGTRYPAAIDLAVTASGALLQGGAAGDRLQASGGGSTVAGGRGDDTVILRGGENRYVFFRADGRDRLYSDGAAGHPDTIVLRDAIGLNETAVSRDGNDLKLSIGAGLDDVRVVDYYLGGVSIRIQLDDGTSLGTVEIASITGVIPPPMRQIDLAEVGGSVYLTGGDDFAVGKGGGDAVRAGAGNDTVDGGPGHDFIEGEAGDDVLLGGKDWDSLLGGPGADLYVFSAGDGPDLVFLVGSPPAGQLDRIRLLGAEPSNVHVSRMPPTLYGAASTSADYLVLARKDGSGEVRVANFFDPAMMAGLEQVEFDDGTRWTAAQLESLATAMVGTQNQLVGTSGNDVHVLDHPGDRVTEAESGGDDTVRTPFTYWADANVERVELTGVLSGSIGGNDLSNVLVGNAAANWIDGRGGDDVLIGGPGDDLYSIAYGGGYDTIVEAADGGSDTLVVGWDGSLPDNVENLVAGTANFGPAYAYGRYLTGNALDNRIDGSNYSGFRVILDGRAGADVMIGGGFSSEFHVDNPGDRVVTTGGRNTVYAAVSYAMGEGVNDLYLRGEAQSGIGNGADNVMSGWWPGKTRSFSLLGGGGDDRYILGAGDLAIEAADAGNDTAVLGYQAALFAVGDFANIENLELTNQSGAAKLLGDGAANRLFGNREDNVIDGGAGSDVLVDWRSLDASGAFSDGPPAFPYLDNDSLTGGAGDDQLVSDAGSDVIDGGTGNDRIVLGLYSKYALIGFGPGGGMDVVESLPAYYARSTAAKVLFGAGLASERATFSLVGGELRVGFDGSGETISFLGYAPVSGASFGGRPLTLDFADGVELGSKEIGIVLADTDGWSAGAGGDFVRGTPQGDELHALAGNDLLLGGAGEDVLDGGEGADVLHGGDGGDTLSGGAGNDVLHGSGDKDLLDGGGGDDVLDGGSGDDVLAGGAGDDLLRDTGGASTYRFGAGFGKDLIEDWTDYEQPPAVDAIVFEASIGSDQVSLALEGWSRLVIRVGGTSDQITVDGFDAAAGSAAGTLEEIRFAEGTVWDHAQIVERASSITGTEGPDVLVADGGAGARIYGLAGNDALTGGAGDDLLDGGTGNDTMGGGFGDDTYVVDTAADVVRENPTEGTDHVLSAVTHTLGTNVENLTLTGAAAINGTGNALANALTGNSANNALSGGAGSDTMAGGAGNDTFVVDSAGDVVVEQAGEGTDLVQSSASYTLGDNVENLILTGSSALTGTGNALDNQLTGNSGANALVGGAGNDTIDGGSGSDTMRGGAGDDTYVVGASGDVVVEHAGEGVDTVRSSVTFTLGDHVEKLTLTGSSSISGTGNALDNVLTGNGANNTLSGGAGNDFLDGGAGSDTMRGGTGDDTFVVNTGTDVVTENSGEGADTVHSSVTLTLASNVEHLLLTGTTAISGTGNSLANHIRGNDATNTLNGAGGNDILQGAGGNDTVTDTSGNNVLDGGDGTDSLSGGTGREFIAGGAGNDTLKLGGGADIIAVNRGHGADSVSAPTSGAGLGETNDTLTLGGMRYADLRLARSGSDLLLKVAGTADSLKFTGWYSASGNRTVTTLQLIVDSAADFNPGLADRLVNRRVVRLSFTSLVNAFNSAYAANPAIGDWAIPAATLSAAFVAGSDTQAIGGALAYHYGHAGGFGALDFAAASAVLSDTNFATAAQTFNVSPTTGGFRLLSVGDADEVSSPAGGARIASASSSRDESTHDGALASSAGEGAAIRTANPAGDEPVVSGRYLTLDAWLLAAEAVSTDKPQAPEAGPTEGRLAMQAGPVAGDEAPGDAGVDSAVLMARRWRAVETAMLGLASGVAAVPGGEAAEAFRPVDDWLGWRAVAAASGSPAGRARGPVAAC